MNKNIEYYLSPQSPWTYLGHERFTAIARKHNATIAIKPINAASIVTPDIILSVYCSCIDGKVNEASSMALTVTLTLELFAQVPVVVYVTVYVPGVEADTSSAPVLVLILNPAVVENIPPTKPVIVAVGSVASAQ